MKTEAKQETKIYRIKIYGYLGRSYNEYSLFLLPNQFPFDFSFHIHVH